MELIVHHINGVRALFDCRRFKVNNKFSVTIFPQPRVISLNCEFEYYVTLPQLTRAISPAGGDFTVEISANRATTSLSYNGIYATDWPDGKTYPENYVS